MATTYIHGDLAIYTGKSITLYGGLFYEVLVCEGHMKGQIKHTSKPPQPIDDINAALKHIEDEHIPNFGEQYEDDAY